MQSNKVYMGQMIRALRKERGLDSGELAKMIRPEKSANAVTCWERGETEPSCEYIVQLCEIFDVDPAVFYNVGRESSKKLSGFEAANLNALGDCFARMNEHQQRAVLGVARAMVE